MVDIKKFSVNNKNIFSKKLLSSKREYLKIFSLPKERSLVLSLDIRRHHFSSGDLSIPFREMFWFIVTGEVLLFFLTYKLVVSFYPKSKKEKVEIIFLVLFFIFLTLPVSHVSDEKISKKENRMLAIKPKFSEIFKKNTDYYRKFESWFSDHFRGRSDFLELHAKIIALNKIVKNGKNHYFYDRDTHWAWEGWILNYKPIINKEMEKQILSGLEKFQKFCREHHIHFYLLIVPERADIYQKVVEKYRRKSFRINDYIINYLEKKATFPIVYPLSTLRKNLARDYVFFKTEHHWTEFGAFLGYQELVGAIQKDFPALRVATEKDFNVFYNNRIRGDWDRKFGLGEVFDTLNIKIPKNELLDTPYKYYEPKFPIKINSSWEIVQKEYINPDNKTGLRAVLAGTSQSENLLQFLPYSFSELKYFRLANFRKQYFPTNTYFKLLKRFKEPTLLFKPNVFILCVSSNNLPRLVDLIKED